MGMPGPQRLDQANDTELAAYPEYALGQQWAQCRTAMLR
eukprot:CAMPEP_0183505176 /NCGR_PEP_ID=MMETSP0371-20130417/6516_1 /TAXON_ID=268820 /ORGANISM="Peridinium aciculiferum, Strain PAER-2" /LENGTH=38 /DNA_ID= /DNA_START= /DNA_END= /DNA_ORIENTATION=